jgi:hypothetical protein
MVLLLEFLEKIERGESIQLVNDPGKIIPIQGRGFVRK